MTRGNIDYPPDTWDYISQEAKDCLHSMLAYKPAKRKEAADLLKHDWIHSASSAPINSAIISRFQHFGGLNRLQQVQTFADYSILTINGSSDPISA